MGDPRKTTDNELIGYRGQTFKFDNSIVYDAAQGGGAAQVGLAVTMTGDEQVGLVGDAERVVGKLITVDKDGFCTVQIEGGCTLPAGDGATVTNGNKIVGDLGVGGAKGYIRNAAVTAAENATGAHEIQNDAVATAVKVMLGR